MDDTSECTCRNGMRDVTEVWARQEAGVPQDQDLAVLDQRARQIATELAAYNADPDRQPAPDVTLLEMWARFVAALNTVFPCPHCRPKQFHRWRHGCYRPNHVAKRCRLCKDTSK